jgi:S1-C subfamily serine protease
MTNRADRKFALAVAFIVALALSVPPVLADSLANTYVVVHKSLVLVCTDKACGTGFIVASNHTSSQILTAAHVVKSGSNLGVYLNDDPNVTYRAEISKVDQTDDLGLITIEKGDLPYLDIGSDIAEGDSIAVAGYPVASFAFLAATKELKPTVHEGVISAVRLSGAIVEYSAVTDFGNSGGPVFNTESGNVIGVVRGTLKNAKGANFGPGFKAVENFLASANVHTAADYATSATLPNVPGAYHILAVGGNSNANDEQAAMLKQLDSDLVGKVAQQLGARVTITDIDLSDSNVVSEACKDQNAIGTMWIGDRWDTKAGLWYSIDGSVEAILTDCAGQVVLRSKKSKNAKVGSYGVSDNQIMSALADLDDQVAADLKSQAESASPSGLKNFLRYGYFIPDGEKRSMFQLAPGANGATVTWLDKRGTAARAGLQVGDVVTSLNGQTLVGIDQDTLSQIVNAATPTGKWTLTVQAADGTSTNIDFVSENIRWYLSHPVS